MSEFHGMQLIHSLIHLAESPVIAVVPLLDPDPCLGESAVESLASLEYRIDPFLVLMFR